MQIIRESEMHLQLQSVIKPTAFSGQSFPFVDLNDRIFEILLYQIFKAKINHKESQIIKFFDNISLMQGVGDKGRDCVLTKKGKNTGLIQCKQVNKNLSKPEIIREISKFAIHAILDKKLIHNINNFTYYIAVSKGLAGTSIALLNNFNNDILNEQSLQKNVEEVLSEYSSFKNISYNLIENELKNILKNIKIQYITPQDISQWLFDYDNIIKNFFRVLTVTDNSLIEYVIKKYLEPTLNRLFPKQKKSIMDFSFRFKEYVEQALNDYSSSKTLIFGNQQKKLEEFYYPLTLICKNDKIKGKNKFFQTLKYEDRLIPKFKKVLIVDSGGMGKSTIMKWLFISVLKQKKGIPIFIELRKLKNKKTIIKEIVTKLNPIDEEYDINFIKKLIAQGNFIFFFDGYDEISDENREFVTSDLQSFISKASNNLYIMTSRPEIALNTFSDFQEFNIKKLEKKQSFELIRKLGNNNEKSIRLIQKIKNYSFSNIDDFLQSPLLVSLLFRKFDYRETIPLKLQEFYNEVFEALFQTHDLTKGDSYVRDKETKLSMSDFFQVLRELAFYTLRLDELEYNQTTLSKYIEEISIRLPNIKINSYKFINDLVKSVPLFNREGLTYRWAHKSFQEYFASEFICRDTKDKQIDILKTMFNSERAEKLGLVFSLCYDIDFKSFREAIIFPYISEFIKYYNSSYKEISSKIEEEVINTRKCLTYNCFHYIFFNKKDFDYILSNEFTLSNIFGDETVQKFPKDYKLRSIYFSDLVLITTTRKYFLNDLLEEKKSPLLKKVKLQNKRHHKFNIKGEYPIDENSNSIINNIKNFNNINELILMQNNSFILDVDNCEKFLKNYQNEQKMENKEYFLNGF